MSQSITLDLADETLQRYQRGAAAAQKSTAEFIADRLTESAPLSAEHLSLAEQNALALMDLLDSDHLRQIAQSQLSNRHQDLYDELLEKNEAGTITQDEIATLQALGDEARRLTLKKAHAYMLLKWRGEEIPSLETLQSAA